MTNHTQTSMMNVANTAVSAISILTGFVVPVAAAIYMYDINALISCALLVDSVLWRSRAYLLTWINSRLHNVQDRHIEENDILGI